MKLVGNKLPATKFKRGDIIAHTKRLNDWLGRVDAVKFAGSEYRLEGVIVSVPPAEELWLGGTFSGPASVYRKVK